MNIITKGELLAVGLGLGVLAYLAHRFAKAAPTAFNPLSDQNLAYRGVNAVGGALVTAPDGNGKNADGSWTLGGWLHDVFHPATAEAVREIGRPGVYNSTVMNSAQTADEAATTDRQIDRMTARAAADADHSAPLNVTADGAAYDAMGNRIN